MSNILISKKKYEDLRKELVELRKEILSQHKSEKRGILESFKEAAIYDVSVQVRESRINELETILKKVEILPEGIKSDNVVLGSYFEIEEEGGEVKKYRLVHPIESEPLKGLVSIDSPLGKAVINKREGSRILFKDKTYVLKSIS